MNSASREQSQKKISSFFFASPSPPKQKAPVVDLTIDSEDETNDHRAEKRPKLSHRNSSSIATKKPFFTPDPMNPLHSFRVAKAGPSDPSTPLRQSSPIQQYRYNAFSPTDKMHPRSPEEVKEKAVRREAFKRKLLNDNSMFSKRARTESPPRDAVAQSLANNDADFEVLQHNREEPDSKVAEDEGSSFPEFLKSYKSKGRQIAVPTASPRKKKAEEVGPSGQAYTPLELQVRELKKKYPDVFLFFEVGYKYRFFGDDARVANKELGVVSFMDRNFLTASVPTHRRDVHVKKLLSKGYKVGIIGQIETAALKKVSDNRNAPFERDLTHLYTAATYIEVLDSVDEDSTDDSSFAPIFACLTETLLGGTGADEKVVISMIAVTPSTGDVVWDEFEDGFLRTELETRMAHLRPSEILLPGTKLSKVTERLLSTFSKEGTGLSVGSGNVRIERYKNNLRLTDATKVLTEFYSAKHESASLNFTSGDLLSTVSSLPQGVTIALAHSLDYLSSFGLAEVLVKTEFFSKFTERRHMLLNANTLANLEIYRNQTDFTTLGSLIWVLDKTQTTFGSRLLRSWIGRPLSDINLLTERVDAIEEMIQTDSPRTRETIHKLRESLKNLPDLAKGLCRIQYGKCSPKELALMLKAFEKISQVFQPMGSPTEVGFKSSILNEIVFSFPNLRDPVRMICSCIDLKKAIADERESLWNDPEKYPDLEDCKFAILALESDLVDELKLIRKTIKKPTVQWSSVAGEDYLIEIGKDERRPIPDDWHIVSTTKFKRRYRTPTTKRIMEEKARYEETLQAEANKAFLSFLHEIIEKHYNVLRKAVNNLAKIDCLVSLAIISAQENYSRPEFVAEDVLEITEGRHPMIELLRSDPIIPNDLCIGSERSRTKIITGPNMGGKSSAVRMVALIVLMAQIGCFVPCKAVKMGLVDSIFTRMGASDDLARGRSTFMVEMSETSNILRSATKRSLIILDELGRGTATFDGMAIAGAVLEHLVHRVKCKTLFITHYPLVALDAEHRFPDMVSNVHMGFTEDTGIDGRRQLTFLYRLTEGISQKSYGIECARLAGITETLLERASQNGEKLQVAVQKKSHISWIRKCCQLVRKLYEEVGMDDIRELRKLSKTALGTS